MTTEPKEDAFASALFAELDSKLFFALTDGTRIQILRNLVTLGRSDVNAIAATVPHDRSVVSRHLAFMRDAGLVTSERSGRHVYYEFDSRFLIGKFRDLADRLEACCPTGLPCCAPVDET